MSLSLNTPDSDYDMTLFSGAWAKKRHPHTHHLHEGTQEISSLRNASGHFLNPTAILSHPGTSETMGETNGRRFRLLRQFRPLCRG